MSEQKNFQRKFFCERPSNGVKIMLFPKKVRKDFPIFERKIRGKPLIYLDSAATSQKPNSVIEAISDFYRNYNANIHRGIYQIAEEATKAYEQVREKTAKFIGAKSSSEIIFTRNTTESINLVAYTFGRENLKSGDNVIVTLMEHHSNFVPWQELCKRKGARFLAAEITKEGKLDLDKFLKLIDKKTKLIALAHISNMLGTINPIEEIIRRVKKKNRDVKVLVDGAQGIAHLKVDVAALDCDFYAFSSHKMLGPTCVGVLFVKKDILETLPPFLTGGHMVKAVSVKETIFNDLPWRFEAGTQNIAGVIGLGKAIDYLEKISLKEIKGYLKNLTAYALTELGSIEGIEIYGPKNPKERASLISFNLRGAHPHDLAQFLDRENIAVRAGHHCALPLHHFFGIDASLRASFYIYNLKEEVDKLKEALVEAKKFFHSSSVNLPRVTRNRLQWQKR